MSRSAIEIDQVDVLFGSTAAVPGALRLLDSGASRDDILSDTGVVVGVADASLSIEQGKLSVLMGLSGSGKSSLLRCVNGLNHITRGALHINIGDSEFNIANVKGKALRKLRRHHLAMVFQQFALLPWATVRENIAFGLSVRGESSAAIAAAVDHQLELVHLQAWADKPIHTLSGGMQQRVGLARAFATDADILLMDEPFSALDPLIREHLQDELLALQMRMRKTIVFVSHDLDEALKLGNQISIMQAGRIVQTGSVADIVFSPASDYVRRFVANINPLSILTAADLMQSVKTDGCRVHLPQWQCDISLLDGRIDRVTVDGGNVSTATYAEQPVKPPQIAVIADCMPIRQLLHQASASTLPILVTHDAQLCGVITQSNILAALIGGHAVSDH